MLAARGSKCLVTGGAGFIGSHLTEALVAAGHQVSVLDDCSTGREANLLAIRDRITTDHTTTDRTADGARRLHRLASCRATRCSRAQRARGRQSQHWG